MPRFTGNIKRRIHNYGLAPSQALMPLFEAVVNSFHAIEDRFGSDDAPSMGEVVIEVTRSTEPVTATSGPKAIPPVRSFTVKDNGVGFDEKHHTAFFESDTPFRERIGGKGTGRFGYVKAFKRVEIESVFARGDDRVKRSFTLSYDYDDIIDPDSEVEEPARQDAPIGTTVRLIDYRLRWKANCHKRADTLIRHIVDHCIDYFVLGQAPSVLLIDGEATYNLRESFQKFRAATSSVELRNGHTLEVGHFLVPRKSRSKHRLLLCGNRRVVEELDLDSDRFPDLPDRISVNDAPLTDQEGDGPTACVYLGYATGDLLDRNVQGERTSFTLMSNLPEESLPLQTQPTLEEVTSGVLDAAGKYLAAYTEPVRVEKLKQVQDYVTNTRQRWAHLPSLREEQIAKAIKPGMSELEMDIELYKVDHEYRAELMVDCQRLLDEIDPDDEDHQDKVDELLEKVDETHKRALCDYVAHRKVLLTALEKAMEHDKFGTYIREEVVHNHILPMGLTTDEHDFELRQNLWVIDERLGLHHWIGSDRQIRTMPAGSPTSQKEPDITAFTAAHALADDRHPDYRSCVIVEFKRPERNDYTRSKNPITQVRDYMDDLREGRRQANNGRTLHTLKDVPFYCYIVCTITPKLRKMAKKDYMFKETPNGQGLFLLDGENRAYIEIMSFDEMLANARKRNRIFFEKLNLPQR